MSRPVRPSRAAPISHSLEPEVERVSRFGARSQEPNPCSSEMELAERPSAYKARTSMHRSPTPIHQEHTQNLTDVQNQYEQGRPSRSNFVKRAASSDDMKSSVIQRPPAPPQLPQPLQLGNEQLSNSTPTKLRHVGRSTPMDSPTSPKQGVATSSTSETPPSRPSGWRTNPPQWQREITSDNTKTAVYTTEEFTFESRALDQPPTPLSRTSGYSKNEIRPPFMVHRQASQPLPHKSQIISPTQPQLQQPTQQKEEINSRPQQQQLPKLQDRMSLEEEWQYQLKLLQEALPVFDEEEIWDEYESKAPALGDADEYYNSVDDWNMESNQWMQELGVKVEVCVNTFYFC